MHDIIIIGSGLSGLSSAVELSAMGRKVLLLEQHKYCGGRVHSFRDPDSGDIIDNGQHMMLGCYHATRRFLKLIGSEHLTSLQTSLKIDYLAPSAGFSSFECPKLPAPFHLVGGLLNFNLIPIKNSLEILRVAAELLKTSELKENGLDKISADEWLACLGQSNANRKYFWDVITVGALNNHPKNVSALMLFRVLRTAFLKRRMDSSILMPITDLSSLFVEPAVRFINSHGGEVLTGVSVDKLTAEGGIVRSAHTAGGNELTAKYFISAVPWYEAGSFLPTGNRPEAFRPSPIISIYIWFDREITNLEFAALTDMHVQWMFNRSKIIGAAEVRTGGQCLSFVISGAEEFLEYDKDRLTNIALDDMRSVLPKMNEAKLIRSLVIKEKRATFLPYPGLEPKRPGARTAFRNLYLAGDWTATGYPATIEGAVISGRTAAKMIGEES